MSQNRSKYVIPFNCEPSIINSLVVEYLRSNEYVLISENNEQYYRSGEPMLKGYRFFAYSITGQNLIIYAWLKALMGEMTLEQNPISIPAINFRESLAILFKKVEDINQGVQNINPAQRFDPHTGQPIVPNPVQRFDPQTGQPIAPNPSQRFDPHTGQPINQTNQFSQTFQNQTNKTTETLGEIAFWCSIVGMILPCLGITFGLPVYLFAIYFACKNLKTRKRGKAIATIVLSGIAIVGLLILVGLSVLGIVLE